MLSTSNIPPKGENSQGSIRFENPLLAVGVAKRYTLVGSVEPMQSLKPEMEGVSISYLFCLMGGILRTSFISWLCLLFRLDLSRPLKSY